MLVLGNKIRNTPVLPTRKDELFGIHDRDAIQRFDIRLGNCLGGNGAVWWKLKVYFFSGQIALVERSKEAEPGGYRKKTGRGFSEWRIRKDGARIVACDEGNVRFVLQDGPRLIVKNPGYVKELICDHCLDEIRVRNWLHSAVVKERRNQRRIERRVS
jgi:hypothetical protein